MASAESTQARRRALTAIAAFAASPALAVAGSVHAQALRQRMPFGPMAPLAPDRSRGTPRGEFVRRHKPRGNIALKGHGFTRDAGGNFATVDVPGAGLFTVVFGIGDDGRAVGGYVDKKGRLRGFLRTDAVFKPIDFPGAAATFVARMNAHGHVVGAYSEQANEIAIYLPHGFLLKDGAFTRIEVPGARRTQPFGINKHDHIVGEYVDGAGRSHGFLLQDGVFTTIDAPDSVATIATDIDDGGRIVGIAGGTLTAARGFLRGADGSFTPIEVPDGNQTYAFGINNRGQIVGRFIEAQGGTRGFLLDAGVYTTTEPPEATGDTLVFDVNDGGELAGTFDLIRHGYLQTRRELFTTIDHPDSVLAEELGGLNNRGQIVSGFFDTTGTLRGYLLDEGGRFTTIEFPGAELTSAYKINDRGQIVGVYETGGMRHGFLFEREELTAIDVPGAQRTQAFDIDHRGQVVGEYQDAAGAFHGFLRDRDGSFNAVDVPGALGTSTTGINDRGQMIGLYADAGGTPHAFLMDHGAVTTIDAPGAVSTLPFGINNPGQIVGVFDDGVRGRGFMWENGKFTAPAIPPGTFGTAFPVDINDEGRIFGVYF